MDTYNNFNIEHIKQLKNCNEFLKELLAHSGEYIQMILTFVDAGIAPPNVFSTLTEELQNHIHHLTNLSFILSEIIGFIEQLTLDTNKENLSMWNKLLFITQELKSKEKVFSQHKDSFCGTLSDSSSLADYWCAQKWPNGKSEFSPVSNALCDMYDQFFSYYQPDLNYIISSVISIAEEKIHVLSNKTESLISTLPNVEDSISVASAKGFQKNNLGETASTNFVQPVKTEAPEIKVTPVPTNPGIPEYIHVNGITYQNGSIQHQNLIDPKDVPLYTNMPQSYWKECRRNLSTDEVRKLLEDISAIPLQPLYEGMISDPYGATPGFCGASYKILEIRYSDGQYFRFEKHRSIPKEYFNIYEILSDFCNQPQVSKNC